MTFGNVDAGKYNVSIYNKLGQKVFEAAINHVGSVNVEKVNLGRLLAAGSYTLQVTGINGSTYRTEMEVK